MTSPTDAPPCMCRNPCQPSGNGDDSQNRKPRSRLISTKYCKTQNYKDERGEQDAGFHYNINKIQTFGFELSVSRTFLDYFTISLSNSTIKQKINVDGIKYKGSHNFSYFLKPSITYNNPKLFSIGLMYIGRPECFVLNYSINSSHWNSEAKAYEPSYSQLEKIQNGAYNRLDLSLSKYIRFKNGSMTIHLSINNLLNTKNETNELYYYSDYSCVYKKYHSLRMWYFGIVYVFHTTSINSMRDF